MNKVTVESMKADLTGEKLARHKRSEYMVLVLRLLVKLGNYHAGKGKEGEDWEWAYEEEEDDENDV